MFLEIKRKKKKPTHMKTKMGVSNRTASKPNHKNGLIHQIKLWHQIPTMVKKEEKKKGRMNYIKPRKSQNPL